MARKKTSTPPKNDFAPEEDFDICSFSSEPTIIGECISSFSFDDNANEDVSISNNNAIPTRASDKTIDLNTSSVDTQNNTLGISSSDSNISLNDKNKLTANRKTPMANGMATPINGEYLDIKRTYMLRASTVRKINELKSIHPELNTYVSTIVDLAIAHYYEHIISGGSQ